MIINLFVRLIIFYILEGIALHFATIFQNVRLLYDTQFGDFDPYIIFGGLVVALFLTGWTLINDVIFLTAPGSLKNPIKKTNHVQTTKNNPMPGAVSLIPSIQKQ
jgi:hypothetical protein